LKAGFRSRLFGDYHFEVGYFLMSR